MIWIIGILLLIGLAWITSFGMPKPKLNMKIRQQQIHAKMRKATGHVDTVIIPLGEPHED